MLIAQVIHETIHTVTETGLGLGAVIAVVCSWERNRSTCWAIVAGLPMWLYVIFFALTRSPEEMR